LLAAGANLPLAAARLAVAFANGRRTANTVREDCDISPAAAGALVGELGALSSPMDRSAAPDVLWKAVSPGCSSVKSHPEVVSAEKVTGPLALEAQLQQAMMQQLAAAAQTPDAVTDDLLSAAAAAAAAAADGGNVWGTTLPFSAAVRQRRFLWTMALLLAALITRTALSILAIMSERRVQVCMFSCLLDFPVFMF
jgi:hypothetical protein